MWTRKELKSKAKGALHRNYWKTVLIALVFTLVCSGAGAFGAAGGPGRVSGNVQADSNGYSITYDTTDEEYDGMMDEYDDIDAPPINNTTGTVGLQDEDDSIVELPHFTQSLSLPEILAIFGVLTLTVVVICALVFALSAFLTNPVEVGTARFFTRNLNQKAEVKEIAFGFDNNYRETVKTMFLRDVFTFLWGLLFVIPGIVKAYEYRMIPYLLADDPTMTKDQAFAQTKRMMNGNKWRTFVLDLSFIGWYLLAIPTLGLSSLFYVSPYKKMTDAALYEELRYGQPQVTEGASLPVSPVDATPAAQVPVPPFAAADAPVPVWDDEDASAGKVPGFDQADDPDGESGDSVVPDDAQA